LNPDISKYFENKKFKILFFDRHWIYKNKKQITSKNLFIVMGKKTNSLLQEIVNFKNIDKNTVFFENSKKIFEIIEVKNVRYLFLNDNIFKEDLEKNIKRLHKNLSKIIKIRGNFLIEGLIILPNQNVFQENSSLSQQEILKETLAFSKILKRICAKINYQIPVFFIEKENSFEVPPFYKIKNRYNTEDDSNFFGFCHKTIKNKEKLHYEIRNSLKNILHSYELDMQYYLQNFEPPFQFQVIQFFYSLKSGIICFSKNYLDHFYKNIETKFKYKINFHYIINLNSFKTLNASENTETPFFNFLEHLSKKMTNNYKLSEIFIKNENKKNVFIMILTLLNVIFTTFCIYNLSSFLKEKREIYIKSFFQLHNFMKIYQNQNAESFNAKKICQLVKNSDTLSSTSFFHPLLYPSWFSHFSDDLTKNYNEQLTKFLSQIFLKSFNEKTEIHFKLSNEKDENQILNQLEYFLTDKINDIYALINTKDSQAIIEMENYLYSINCEKNLFRKLTFENFDITKTPFTMIIDYKKFKEKSLKKLDFLMNSYLDKYILNNKILKKVSELNDHLRLLKKISYEKDHIKNILFAKDLSEKIESLNQELLENQDSFSNSQKFYSADFSKILTDIEKNPTLGKEISAKFSEISQERFQKLKNELAAIQISSNPPFPLLLIESNSFHLNSALLKLSSTIKTMFQIYNDSENSAQDEIFTNETSKKLTSFSHENFSEKVLWDIDCLKNSAEKGSELLTTVSSIKKTYYPQILTVFFENFQDNLSETFWNNHLSKCLKTSPTDFQELETLAENYDLNDQNIQKSALILKNISDQLIISKQKKLNSTLITIANKKIDSRIKKYSKILNSSLFFEPVQTLDFQWWDGHSSPAYKIYSLNSEEDLNAYILNQKNILEQFFNKNIQPILQARSLLVKDDSDSMQSEEVTNLLLMQDTFSAAPKSNTFGIFSHFLKESISSLRIENCRKFINTPPFSLGKTDFFSVRQESIYLPLAQRCKSLLVHQAYTNYTKFADKFNHLLAQKFPFQQESNESTNLEDLQSIVLDFSLLKKQDIEVLKKYSSLFSERKDIQKFIENFSQIEKVFSLELDKDGNLIPIKCTVEVQFRTRKEKEILGNQIINWSLRSGQNTVGSEENNKEKFTWNYGDHLQFEIKLANSSKYSLKNPDDNRTYSIIKNTIYIHERNPWSLIKFISNYSHCKNKAFCTNNDLKFEFPLDGDKKMRFYVSLNIKDKKNDTIKIPEFPKKAPYFKKK
jgi:hypothetical protein